LTNAGHIFLGEACAVLARADAAELVLSDLSGLHRGFLHVHASQTIASHWLPRHLVAFRAAYPEIAVRIAVGNTADVP
jgi:DNA-binding transcriptional LysR family regulator